MEADDLKGTTKNSKEAPGIIESDIGMPWKSSVPQIDPEIKDGPSPTGFTSDDAEEVSRGVKEGGYSNPGQSEV